MQVEVEEPMMEIQGLTFAYGGNTVLDHVSFSIRKGDYIGIIGPNGGGKTTLIKILTGLLKPHSGAVTISGAPAARYRDKYKIGYVPQRIAQHTASFPATVLEIVESGRTPAKGWFAFMDENDRLAASRALEVAGIAELKNKLMSELSGGQRKRVFIARALAAESEILILDEPFVGVDIAAQTEFYAFLKDLNERNGLTILFVSHDIDVVTNEAKTILCLNRGLLCFESSARVREEDLIEKLYGKKMTHLHRAP
ncbi:MAG: metal ABC transporter ATP-binding protein [Candidatus Sungbacteria bacterium]|uniref:Metal ABC transporter ATP-binding protein n=1 Tax=Candidatus Sungiibacteriota bacterium TaxID=2750080 RepID=A0A932QXW1_9BACT|nr:metal ABC transporter ATP-binding protein [Candidatus Sungbacteria bacterium]